MSIKRRINQLEKSSQTSLDWKKLRRLNEMINSEGPTPAIDTSLSYFDNLKAIIPGPAKND